MYSFYCFFANSKRFVSSIETTYTVHSRYYEPLYNYEPLHNEPPYIMNNFWLFSGSISIEIMLKNSCYNERVWLAFGHFIIARVYCIKL